MLCRTITGEGQTKRQLYTDTNEIIFNYKRKIILNGIFPSIEYSDLRDRIIIYETLPLRESDRITEEKFNKLFDDLLPFVLGEIFQTLQKSLSIYDSVKTEIENMPRMADFTIFGECISRSLGCMSLSFADDYRQRIELNSLDVVESYPIIKLIEKILEEQPRYENTVSSFHKHITKLAELEGIEINSPGVKFPSSPNKIKSQIERLKPNLRSLEIDVDIQTYDKRDKKYPRGSHIVSIRRIALEDYQESLSSLSPLSENDKIKK
jgi:hypothetical protein